LLFRAVPVFDLLFELDDLSVSQGLVAGWDWFTPAQWKGLPGDTKKVLTKAGEGESLETKTRMV